MGQAARIALGSPQRLRRLMIAGYIRNLRWLEERRRPDSAALLAAVAPMGHVAGTCRMGTAEDSAPWSTVIVGVMGVEGLRSR